MISFLRKERLLPCKKNFNSNMQMRISSTGKRFGYIKPPEQVRPAWRAFIDRQGKIGNLAFGSFLHFLPPACNETKVYLQKLSWIELDSFVILTSPFGAFLVVYEHSAQTALHLALLVPHSARRLHLERRRRRAHAVVLKSNRKWERDRKEALGQQESVVLGLEPLSFIFKVSCSYNSKSVSLFS